MKYQRRIVLENIINCRDLGGHPCSDGGTTKFGKVLRAGIPKPPTQNDIKLIKDYGISTIIDLRGDNESQRMPSPFKGLDGCNYHHASLLEISPAKTADETKLIDFYKRSIDKHKENFAKIFSIFSETQDNLMFHCFFGKDRTGILAAFLLRLAGVAIEDIVADYQITFAYLKPFYDKEIESNSGLIWETNMEHLQSDAQTILGLLKYVDSKYGGIKSYLRECGVSEQELVNAANLLK